MKLRFQVAGDRLRKGASGSEGFTLLEIMIALAILSISLLSLYSSIGNSLKASGFAEDMDRAMQLARQRMSEIRITLDEEMARGAFPDEKEEEGTFDKPNDRFKWSYTLRKVEVPAINPAGLEGGVQGTGAPAGEGEGSTTPTTQPTPGIEQAATNMAQVVSKKISESIRELKLTVSWGEAAEGEEEEHVVLTTHVVKLR